MNFWASESYNIQGIEIAKEVERSKIKDERYKNIVVKATLGWHPLECVDGTILAEDIPARMKQLRDLYSENKEHIVAIGETWIDVHYPNGPETLETQKKLFIEHCKLAKELNLPLVVHSRDAFQETMQILRHFPRMTVYFHCRGYWPQEIEALRRMGESKWRNLFIWFCGNITYKKADDLRESIKLVPLDQLLLETDAPYLTPQEVRGETNQPAYVKYIYQYVAALDDIPLAGIEDQLEKNFVELYRI